MRKTKEVLRLKFELGLGLRQIARSCSLGLGTVHDYLQRAKAGGISWPLPEGWTRRGWNPLCSAARNRAPPMGTKPHSISPPFTSRSNGTGM